MSDKVGPVYYGGSQEVFLGRDYQTQHSYSEAVASQIDAEVKRLLDEAHAKAVKILTENRKIMENMARVLLECETIYSEEVDMLMDGASPDEVKKALAERLSYKAAHKNDMEKAPIKKLSDFQPITEPEKPSFDYKSDAPANTADNGLQNGGAVEPETDKPTEERAPTKKPIKRTPKPKASDADKPANAEDGDNVPRE